MYEEYKDLATRIRRDCLHMVYVGQSGHIGSMLSATDIMAVSATAQPSAVRI